MSTITTREYETALRDWLGDRVKFEPGWRTRTSSGPFDAHGFVHHWDAIPRRYSLATHRRVLRAGTQALPGPLCHLAPARNGDLWVIAGPHANANHAGNGDREVYARVLAGTFAGSPAPLKGRETVNGNDVLYGLEYMYHPDDGTMPDAQVETGILAAAALAQAHGWKPDAAAGSCLDHYEWASRKWDREKDNLANRTREGVREALQRGTKEDDDMPTPKEIADAVWDHRLNVLGAKSNKAAGALLTETHYRAGGARSVARNLQGRVSALRRAVDALPDGATKAEVKGLLESLDAEINLIVKETS